jgi:hypothetical protein
MGLLRRPTPGEIVEGGRFSRPLRAGRAFARVPETSLRLRRHSHYLLSMDDPTRLARSHVWARMASNIRFAKRMRRQRGCGSDPDKDATRPERGGMARIYVSSTYGDLREHREQVYRALRELGHNVIAMEDYVAGDQRPLAKCLADLASCDVYVGIFAHRYGYIPDRDNPEGRSITELEYRHAEDQSIPRLVFLLDQSAPWQLAWVDAVTGDSEQGARIQALREELGRERLVSFFSSAGELARKVSNAVTTQLAEVAIDQNAYQLVAGLPALPAGRGWTIPPPVRSFTGRDGQLAALHDQLTGRGAAALVPTAALYGMGGVGKTQLALAYAQRYRDEYELGWWIPAETELGLLTALAGLGAALSLPAELQPTELALRIRGALAERSGWLLIFDNAPHPSAVAEFLPGEGGGHVVITSRDSAWHGIAEPISVDLLALDDAVELLLRRTGDPDEEAAAVLAEVLGRLPLALEQAAAYAEGQHLTLARYLELFNQRRAELLKLGKPLAYQGTVDATFTLTLDQLRTTNPVAVLLEELCSLLAPDEIPLPELLGDPTLLPDPLATAATDPLQRSGVVGVLYRQGLLTRDTADTARMHRLVQAVTLAHLADPDRRQRTDDAVQLLAGLFPDNADQPDRWPRCAQLLAHAQAVLDHARTLNLTSLAMSTLLENTYHYLSSRGLEVQARKLAEQALAIHQQLYQGDHPAIARSLNDLASTLNALGNPRRAQGLHEQALAMRQRLYQGDHPDTALSLNNLAVLHTELGARRRARELYEQALAMRQRLHRGDHPEIAVCLANLGVAQAGLGARRRAQGLYEQALAMRQRLYQGDHPQVAHSLNTLAVVQTGLGARRRARELHEQALAMRQRLYQGDHPHVAYNLAILARVQTGLGARRRARELHEQALAMHQRLYQGDHPHVAHSLADLARDLALLGHVPRAWALFWEARKMRRRISKREAASPD